MGEIKRRRPWFQITAYMLMLVVVAACAYEIGQLSSGNTDGPSQNVRIFQPGTGANVNSDLRRTQSDYRSMYGVVFTPKNTLGISENVFYGSKTDVSTEGGSTQNYPSRFDNTYCPAGTGTIGGNAMIYPRSTYTVADIQTAFTTYMEEHGYTVEMSTVGGLYITSAYRSAHGDYTNSLDTSTGQTLKYYAQNSATRQNAWKIQLVTDMGNNVRIVLPHEPCYPLSQVPYDTPRTISESGTQLQSRWLPGYQYQSNAAIPPVS